MTLKPLDSTRGIDLLRERILGMLEMTEVESREEVENQVNDVVSALKNATDTRTSVNVRKTFLGNLNVNLSALMENVVQDQREKLARAMKDHIEAFVLDTEEELGWEIGEIQYLEK